MAIVLIGGIFSVLTLLVKAAIDVGSKTSRRRRSILADVDLLEKLPDPLRGWASADDLRDRIDRQLTEYALSDLAPSAAKKARESKSTLSVDRRVTALGTAAALAAALAGSGVVSWAADRVSRFDPDVVGALAAVVAAIGGIVISLVVSRAAAAQSRLTLEQWREDPKRRK